MKLTKLALAVATTLVAGQAFAVPVTQANVVSARSAGTLKEVWLSGASAPTFNVFDSFARGCDADSLSIFTNNTAAGKPGSTGDYNAYACTRAGVVTVAYHTMQGGSFNAFAPHLPASLGVAPDGSAFPAVLQRVKNVGTVTCSGSGVYTPTNSPSYLTVGTTIPVSFGCTRGTAASLADSAPALPHGGFSDVEAKLWGYDVSESGTEASVNVQQAFGIVVTTKLYRALQVAQGIYASTAAADSADASYSPENAPNITASQYAAIAQDGGGYQADWSKMLGDAGVGKTVTLVRRVGTSGTQASSNAFFLSNPCSSGAAQGQLFPAATQTSAAFVVSEQSGTSGVKSRLTTINNDATQNFGLGVVSLENTTDAGYKFVKIDGVHPEAGDTTNARVTMANGTYRFVMEMVSFIPTSSAGTYAETLINEIAANLGSPATCTDVGRGLSLSPAGGSACEVGTYVSKGTKFGNNCAPMQLFY